MNKTHELKVWPDYFAALIDEENTKSFEIRENDRDYRVGDWLRLREWNPNTNDYTGSAISVRVTYMTDYMQQPGYVVLGIR